ncbi:MAG: hypothetical protein AAGC81_14335 [Pseudomonadota bacterium]
MLSTYTQIPISFTGVIALVLSLALALGLARDGLTRAYYVGLLVLHLIGTVIFYALTIRSPADAHVYYAKSEWVRDFDVGTQFISFLLGWVREFTDLTMLDAFLVFQIPGLLGIIFLHRTAVRFAAEQFDTRVVLLAVILMMPGLHLWTSSIGKDSLAIFAFGLIAMAMVQKEIHLGLLAAGLIVYFCVRPHIAFELALAMSLAFLPIFGYATKRTQFVGIGTAILFLAMLPFIFLFVGIDGNGSEGVQNYVENRQNRAFRGGSSFSLGALNPVERILTVMFRPLFFDASGVLGLVASIENLFLITVFAYLAWNTGVILRLMSRSAMLRFNVFFVLIFMAVFSQTTGNLGLALRQKMMLIPALFLILTAVIAYHNRRRQDRRAALKSSLDPIEQL